MLSEAVRQAGKGRRARDCSRRPGPVRAVTRRLSCARASRTTTLEFTAIGAPHIPVLLSAVVEAFAPIAGGIVLDGTFGAGGYTRALLAADPARRVVGVDRDPDAVAAGQEAVGESAGRLTLVRGRFGQLDRIADELEVALDGVVIDIGVSSMQLDQAARGFSFRQDGPLDMRMDQDGPSAANLVNETDETELANIIYRYGEERRSRHIARAIVDRRREAPFRTTSDLAALVARIVRSEPGVHPATRTFQALRIAVNDELGELERGLRAAERALRPGGRLAVVTFHSLEDRLVKQFLQGRANRVAAPSRHLPSGGAAEAATFALLGRSPVAPGPDEVARNPRARSAKMRVAERTGAPARADDRRPGGAR